MECSESLKIASTFPWCLYVTPHIFDYRFNIPSFAYEPGNRRKLHLKECLLYRIEPVLDILWTQYVTNWNINVKIFLKIIVSFPLILCLNANPLMWYWRGAWKQIQSTEDKQSCFSMHSYAKRKEMVYFHSSYFCGSFFFIHNMSWSVLVAYLHSNNIIRGLTEDVKIAGLTLYRI